MSSLVTKLLHDFRRSRKQASVIRPEDDQMKRKREDEKTEDRPAKRQALEKRIEIFVFSEPVPPPNTVALPSENEVLPSENVALKRGREDEPSGREDEPSGREKKQRREEVVGQCRAAVPQDSMFDRRVKWQREIVDGTFEDALHLESAKRKFMETVRASSVARVPTMADRVSVVLGGDELGAFHPPKATIHYPGGLKRYRSTVKLTTAMYIVVGGTGACSLKYGPSPKNTELFPKMYRSDWKTFSENRLPSFDSRYYESLSEFEQVHIVLDDPGGVHGDVTIAFFPHMASHTFVKEPDAETAPRQRRARLNRDRFIRDGGEEKKVDRLDKEEDYASIAVLANLYTSMGLYKNISRGVWMYVKKKWGGMLDAFMELDVARFFVSFEDDFQFIVDTLHKKAGDENKVLRDRVLQVHKEMRLAVTLLEQNFPSGGARVYTFLRNRLSGIIFSELHSDFADEAGNPKPLPAKSTKQHDRVSDALLTLDITQADVANASTQEELKTLYRKRYRPLALKLHPDKNDNKDKNGNKDAGPFIKLNKAYVLLLGVGKPAMGATDGRVLQLKHNDMFVLLSPYTQSLLTALREYNAIDLERDFYGDVARQLKPEFTGMREKRREVLSVIHAMVNVGVDEKKKMMPEVMLANLDLLVNVMTDIHENAVDRAEDLEYGDVTYSVRRAVRTFVRGAKIPTTVYSFVGMPMNADEFSEDVMAPYSLAKLQATFASVAEKFYSDAKTDAKVLDVALYALVKSARRRDPEWGSTRLVEFLDAYARRGLGKATIVAYIKADSASAVEGTVEKLMRFSNPQLPDAAVEELKISTKGRGDDVKIKYQRMTSAEVELAHTVIGPDFERIVSDMVGDAESHEVALVMFILLTHGPDSDKIRRMLTADVPALVAEAATLVQETASSGTLGDIIPKLSNSILALVSGGVNMTRALPGRDGQLVVAKLDFSTRGLTTEQINHYRNLMEGDAGGNVMEDVRVLALEVQTVFTKRGGRGSVGWDFALLKISGSIDRTPPKEGDRRRDDLRRSVGRAFDVFRHYVSDEATEQEKKRIHRVLVMYALGSDANAARASIFQMTDPLNKTHRIPALLRASAGLFWRRIPALDADMRKWFDHRYAEHIQPILDRYNAIERKRDADRSRIAKATKQASASSSTDVVMTSRVDSESSSSSSASSVGAPALGTSSETKKSPSSTVETKASASSQTELVLASRAEAAFETLNTYAIYLILKNARGRRVNWATLSIFTSASLRELASPAELRERSWEPPVHAVGFAVVRFLLQMYAQSPFDSEFVKNVHTILGDFMRRNSDLDSDVGITFELLVKAFPKNDTDMARQFIRTWIGQRGLVVSDPTDALRSKATRARIEDIVDLLSTEVVAISKVLRQELATYYAKQAVNIRESSKWSPKDVPLPGQSERVVRPEMSDSLAALAFNRKYRDLSKGNSGKAFRWFGQTFEYETAPHESLDEEMTNSEWRELGGMVDWRTSRRIVFTPHSGRVQLALQFAAATLNVRVASNEHLIHSRDVSLALGNLNLVLSTMLRKRPDGETTLTKVTSTLDSIYRDWIEFTTIVEKYRSGAGLGHDPEISYPKWAQSHVRDATKGAEKRKLQQKNAKKKSESQIRMDKLYRRFFVSEFEKTHNPDRELVKYLVKSRGKRLSVDNVLFFLALRYMTFPSFRETKFARELQNDLKVEEKSKSKEIENRTESGLRRMLRNNKITDPIYKAQWDRYMLPLRGSRDLLDLLDVYLARWTAESTDAKKVLDDLRFQIFKMVTDAFVKVWTDFLVLRDFIGERDSATVTVPPAPEPPAIAIMILVIAARGGALRRVVSLVVDKIRVVRASQSLWSRARIDPALLKMEQTLELLFRAKKHRSDQVTELGTALGHLRELSKDFDSTDASIVSRLALFEYKENEVKNLETALKELIGLSNEVYDLDEERRKLPPNSPDAEVKAQRRKLKRTVMGLDEKIDALEKEWGAIDPLKAKIVQATLDARFLSRVKNVAGLAQDVWRPLAFGLLHRLPGKEALRDKLIWFHADSLLVSDIAHSSDVRKLRKALRKASPKVNTFPLASLKARLNDAREEAAWHTHALEILGADVSFKTIKSKAGNRSFFSEFMGQVPAPLGDWTDHRTPFIESSLSVLAIVKFIANFPFLPTSMRNALLRRAQNDFVGNVTRHLQNASVRRSETQDRRFITMRTIFKQTRLVLRVVRFANMHAFAVSANDLVMFFREIASRVDFLQTKLVGLLDYSDVGNRMVSDSVYNFRYTVLLPTLREFVPRSLKYAREAVVMVFGPTARIKGRGKNPGATPLVTVAAKPSDAMSVYTLDSSRPVLLRTHARSYLSVVRDFALGTLKHHEDAMKPTADDQKNLEDAKKTAANALLHRERARRGIEAFLFSPPKVEFTRAVEATLRRMFVDDDGKTQDETMFPLLRLVAKTFRVKRLGHDYPRDSLYRVSDQNYRTTFEKVKSRMDVTRVASIKATEEKFKKMQTAILYITNAQLTLTAKNKKSRSEGAMRAQFKKRGGAGKTVEAALKQHQAERCLATGATVATNTTVFKRVPRKASAKLVKMSQKQNDAVSLALRTVARFRADAYAFPFRNTIRHSFTPSLTSDLVEGKMDVQEEKELNDYLKLKRKMDVQEEKELNNALNGFEEYMHVAGNVVLPLFQSRTFVVVEKSQIWGPSPNVRVVKQELAALSKRGGAVDPIPEVRKAASGSKSLLSYSLGGLKLGTDALDSYLADLRRSQAAVDDVTRVTFHANNLQRHDDFFTQSRGKVRGAC